jgi:histone H3/H4
MTVFVQILIKINTRGNIHKKSRNAHESSPKDYINMDPSSSNDDFVLEKDEMANIIPEDKPTGTKGSIQNSSSSSSLSYSVSSLSSDPSSDSSESEARSTVDSINSNLQTQADTEMAASEKKDSNKEPTITTKNPVNIVFTHNTKTPVSMTHVNIGDDPISSFHSSSSSSSGSETEAYAMETQKDVLNVSKEGKKTADTSLATATATTTKSTITTPPPPAPSSSPNPRRRKKKKDTTLVLSQERIANILKTHLDSNSQISKKAKILLTSQVQQVLEEYALAAMVVARKDDRTTITRDDLGYVASHHSFFKTLASDVTLIAPGKGVMNLPKTQKMIKQEERMKKEKRESKEKMAKSSKKATPKTKSALIDTKKVAQKVSKKRKRGEPEKKSTPRKNKRLRTKK